MPHLRNKPAKALTGVSAQRPVLDVRAGWGDGKARRPIMLILMDVASDTTLDFTLSRSTSR